MKQYRNQLEKKNSKITSNKSKNSDSVSAIRAVFEANYDEIARRIFFVDHSNQGGDEFSHDKKNLETAKKQCIKNPDTIQVYHQFRLLK